MTLNRIVGLVVMVALTSAAVPASAEEREGALVPRTALAARPLDCCSAGGPVESNRQLVTLPSPVYPMPGERVSMRTLAWAAISVAALMTYVRITVPTR
jgi:hypothetical protein